MLILLDAPVVVGCVLTVRLLGVIEAEQEERDGERVRNDRLIAAATHAHTHEHFASIEDLPPYLMGEIEGYFAQFNRLRGKEFKPLGRGGTQRAHEMLDRARAALREKEQG